MMNESQSLIAKGVVLDYPLLKEGKRFLKESLTKRFSSQRREMMYRALDGVNLSIERGDVVGIVGRNGAGKSTILRVLAGILPPDEGEVWTRGRVGLLAGIGAGMQANLSGIENIELSGSIYGLSREEIAAKIENIVEFSGVGQFIYQPVRTYSSGMKARLGFSISAHISPDILLIDEVFSVGDGEFGNKSHKMISKMIEGGTTVVMVSHSMALIGKICTKAYFMEKGKIIGDGNVNDAISQYANLG